MAGHNKEVKAMQEVQQPEKMLLNAKEVAAILGVKVSYAYKVIKKLNDELKAANKLVVAGKINKNYLFKKLEV